MEQNSVRMRIKTQYRDMSYLDKQIADYVLDNIEKVSKTSIAELADDLNISSSTFFQFAKRLGYEGFKDFKIALLTEDSAPSPNLKKEIEKGDTAFVVTQKVFDSSIKALNDSKSLIDDKNIGKAVEYLCSSNHICFFGLGGSATVASDAYHKFLRSNINCYYSADYHIQLMHASLLNANDSTIVISHSGLSKEAIEFAKLAKERGAKIIVITGYSSSPLAKMADIVLLSIADQISYRSESFASRLSQLCIIDSLFVNVMMSNEKESKKSLKLIHDATAVTKVKA